MWNRRSFINKVNKRSKESLHELNKKESNDESVQLIDKNLKINKEYLENLFHRCSDVIIHEFKAVSGMEILLLKVDGLTDSTYFDEMILESLMFGVGVNLKMEEHPPRSIDDLIQRFIAIGQTEKVTTLTDAINHALTGEAMLFFDGYDVAISVSAKKWEHRTPEEPSTEAVIRGPREGFVENVRTNTALLRRRIRTPHLKMEELKIGRVTKTDVVLTYIEGIVTDSVVDELRNRLQRIETDGIIDSGYVQEFIEDEPYSFFPQIQETERPDTAAANLLEGRCVVLTDGSPFALIAPINLWGSLQANEDYYQRFMPATVIRWIRYVFTAIALLFPSLYIAITTFHQEMLPTNLVLSLAAAREASPFPALVEALIMEITFEALREAGVRLPKAVGQAVSIVGALVIGQAAVQAGIVSAPMVIVVSITGIANFTIPRYSFALGIRILRFPFMLLAASFGLYGIVIGLIGMIGHICAMRSLGVPYVAPVAPFDTTGIKDTFYRAPWFLMNRRPRLMGYQNSERIPNGQKPSPPNQLTEEKEDS